MLHFRIRRSLAPSERWNVVGALLASLVKEAWSPLRLLRGMDLGLALFP